MNNNNDTFKAKLQENAKLAPFSSSWPGAMLVLVPVNAVFYRWVNKLWIFGTDIKEGLYLDYKLARIKKKTKLKTIEWRPNQ